MKILVLKILTVFLLTIILIIAWLTPASSEIPLANLVNRYLIGCAGINLKDKETKNLIQDYLNDFEQKKSSLRPLPKLFHWMQNYALEKLLPYSVGCLIYASSPIERPKIVLTVNFRINQYLLQVLGLPIIYFSSKYFRKDFSTHSIAIGQKKLAAYRLANYWIMFYRNLCLISDTSVALQYPFSDTTKAFPPNFLTTLSLIDTSSNCWLIFDNRHKTVKSTEKYFNQEGFGSTNELEIEYFPMLIDRYKIYVDSVAMTGIETKIVDANRIIGRWLIIMNSPPSARKFAFVIDCLHQMISLRLEGVGLNYTVKRIIDKNQIVSEFEIKGIRKLFQSNIFNFKLSADRDSISN